MTDNASGHLHQQWSPIEELPEDWHLLVSEQLPTLAQVWDEQRDLLTKYQVQTFNEQLQREWAIETGVIERLYSLDRGLTELLIERGLDASLIGHADTDSDPQHVIGLIQDQKSAVELVFDYVRGDRPLSKSYLHELHQLFTRRQKTTTAVDQFGNEQEVPLESGVYKRFPNNPRRPDGSLHEYCPPEHVESEMDRLFSMHREHFQRGVPPEVEAAWLHHRFTEIHPYQDGNGRLARAMASHVMIRAGWFPLTVTRDERTEYLDALEAADRGILGPLVELFCRLEIGAFKSALSIARDIERQDRNIGHLIGALRDRIRTDAPQQREEWQHAKSLASHLTERGHDRFQVIARDLELEVGPHMPGSEFFAALATPDSERSHYYYFQIVEVAKKLEYFANTRDFHTWARLVFRMRSQPEILLTFHTLGHEFRGVVVGTLIWFRRERLDEGSQVIDIAPLCSSSFQITYREPAYDALEARFDKWLEDGLVAGLDRLYSSE